MPNQSEQMKDVMKESIDRFMEKVIRKVTEKDPFDLEAHRKFKRHYAALVPDEIFKGAHFERRFVTPFGSLWEELAVIAANHGVGSGSRGDKITGSVGAERLERITEVLRNLEHPAADGSRVRPDWDRELEYVLSGSTDQATTVSVICDVVATDTTHNKTWTFELKAPLPNSDQTKVSKEKILKLYAMSPSQVDDAYYVLPYNPYGRREDYNWPHPARWFDMRNDPVVLIGIDFWEKIGPEDTLQILDDAFSEIGEAYQEFIYRRYLGIEPPGSERE